MFKEISPNELNFNVFDVIGKDWLLITAGDDVKCNTMTASWAQMGIMWGMPVVNVYIRPQRYTRAFVDGNDKFTVSIFEPRSRRSELNLLGTKSGRDGDKISEAGLTVQAFDGVPGFAEAKIVMVCRKLYQHDLSEDGFLDKSISDDHYTPEDYHRCYIAEIEKVYMAE